MKDFHSGKSVARWWMMSVNTSVTYGFAKATNLYASTKVADKTAMPTKERMAPIIESENRAKYFRYLHIASFAPFGKQLDSRLSVAPKLFCLVESPGIFSVSSVV